jgi:dolichyl-phosphate beta-glucosyltransferase
MAVALSLVIPAFNESRRLPLYLPLVRRHLQAAYPGAYEVIVVNDGSQDGLGEFLSKCGASWPALVVASHPRNLGKGAAIRSGVLAARGQLVMFADADGASPIEEEARLRRAIEQGADIAAGSRLLPGVGLTRRRSWRRAGPGLLFAWWGSRSLALPVRDPQCGFKMFRREAACRLFALSRESGYTFDLEVLGLAQALGYRIAEVPVSWREVPGSKVRLVRDGWAMLCRTWALRCTLRAVHPCRGPIGAQVVGLPGCPVA